MEFSTKFKVMRLEVLTVVTMRDTDFWNVTPCSLACLSTFRWSLIHRHPHTESAGSSKTLENVCKTTCCHSPEQKSLL